ncbi:1-acyl-sn-glycerol-3-phosphate acyltransferase [Candidatus Saccharibacteria bacterium]|nr:1-acyl-sn-glycerol-3-phosphate acyltransferase [Candidatus Saccharibacteria bacterium]
MAKAELFQKDIPESERVFYYESEESDPIQTDEQERHEEVGLPDGYEFIPRHWWVRAYSAIMFRAFWIFGQWYERRYWGVKVHGREKLKAARGKGYVIYATHTNPFHDVFGPAIAADRRIFTVISPVNLKIPGIGPILPMIGGLPLGKTREEKHEFNVAVDRRLAQKKVLVIYPEAHVWPYYTGVRKFPAGGRSFKYAVRNNLPVYAMTTTYHRREGRDLPRMEVYLDGPFYPEKGLGEAENCEALAEKVHAAMVRDAKNSDYDYFKYVKKPAGGGAAPTKSGASHSAKCGASQTAKCGASHSAKRGVTPVTKKGKK